MALFSIAIAVCGPMISDKTTMQRGPRLRMSSLVTPSDYSTTLTGLLKSDIHVLHIIPLYTSTIRHINGSKYPENPLIAAECQRLGYSIFK